MKTQMQISIDTEIKALALSKIENISRFVEGVLRAQLNLDENLKEDPMKQLQLLNSNLSSTLIEKEKEIESLKKKIENLEKSKKEVKSIVVGSAW